MSNPGEMVPSAEGQSRSSLLFRRAGIYPQEVVQTTAPYHAREKEDTTNDCKPPHTGEYARPDQCRTCYQTEDFINTAYILREFHADGNKILMQAGSAQISGIPAGIVSCGERESRVVSQCGDRRHEDREIPAPMPAGNPCNESYRDCRTVRRDRPRIPERAA